MKKSEILKILGSYAVNYNVENSLANDWLVVEVTALTAFHMSMLEKYILSIDVTDNRTMNVNFCSTIIID